MSRTIKDKPSKILHEPWDKDRVLIGPLYRYIWRSTTKTKKKKQVDTEWHWMTTPGHWIRLKMNKPQRRKAHIWEQKVLISDIEEIDHPNVSRKPHVYYW